MDYKNLFVLFETAIANKLRFPKLRLQVGNETLVVKLNGSKSKYMGDISLANDAGFGSSASRYYGRISKDNNLLLAGRDMTPAMEAFVQALAADPVGVCAANGKLSGSCVFCQKPLTDANSLAHGWGPVCAKKYNLPWNAAKQARKSRKAELAQDVAGPAEVGEDVIANQLAEVL